MIKNFLFFDIDGVLINPLGYRQATKDTIARFFSEEGLRNINVLESDLLAFEAQGITSEWDMVPLFLLAWMELCFRNYPPKFKINDRENLSQYLRTIGSTNFPLSEVISGLGDGLEPGLAPAESILKEIFFRDKGLKKLPFVYKFADWMIKEFLSTTRNIEVSETTRTFQNLVLGDRVFNEICGLPALINTESYLIKFDENLLDEFSVSALKRVNKQQSAMLCAITARPSLMTNIKSINPNSGHYFPEAELAMKKIALDQMKVIGFGTLSDLAGRIGMNPDALVKPSFFHALVAMAVSCEITFDKILDFMMINREGFAIPGYRYKGIKSIFPDWVYGNKLVFHIFEDSMIGIQSVKALNLLLNQNSIESSVIAYGIASNPLKVEALKRENAWIFENINQAFQYYLENTPI